MYRVESTMGDTVFQVLDWQNIVVRRFYTEQIAKEFADRLTAEEYFKIHKKENSDMEELKKCVVIETDFADAFEDAMNEFLNKGYKVESSSCNSKYYKAILILDANVVDETLSLEMK